MKKTTNFVCALLFLLIAGIGVVKAQSQVEMTTSLPVGADFSFTVNSGASITVDWGDGTPVAVVSNGAPITGPLKGNVVKISGDMVSLLDCSSQSLTALVTDNATALRVLYCADNDLAALTLSKNTELLQLDCSGNKLTTISLTANKKLTFLDCSDNALTAISTRYCVELEQLLCSNNSITTLSLTHLPKLKTLWCEGNKLSALTISSNPLLESVICDDNNISRINVSSALYPQMTDFWCANNNLTNLILNGASNIETLNLEDNQISAVTLSALSKPALAVYMGNNALDFSFFYNKDRAGHISYTNQAPFALSASEVDIDEVLNCPDIRKDIEENSVATTYTWINDADNSTLARGAKKDYVTVSGKTYSFKFKKAFESIHCEATSTYFPGVTLTSEPLRVIDPNATAIREATQNSGFTYFAVAGALHMSAQSPLAVAIYTLEGKLVWSGTVGQNGTRVPLSRGVYLVNNIKVAL